MNRWFYQLACAISATTLAACTVTAPIAHTTGTKSTISQDEIPFEPTPPEILATLPVPVLVEYIQDRLKLIETNRKWKRGLPTLEIALDELASRGEGEAYEVLVTALTQRSFSRSFDDRHQVNLSTRWKVNKKGKREVAYTLSTQNAERLLPSDAALKAYKILRSLAASGYGTACSKFLRAYDLSKRGFLHGVAGEPAWDDATWEDQRGRVSGTREPVGKIGGYSGVIPIPTDVVNGCANASNWTSLTGDAAAWAGVHANPNIDVDRELQRIRAWGAQWQAILTRYETNKHLADQLWSDFQANYRLELSRLAAELSAELERRGFVVNTTTAELDMLISRWHKTRGPFFAPSDTYAGRQLAAGSDWVARYKMRNAIILEEKRLISSGVQGSADSTPLYFVAMAGRALGTPLDQLKSI